MSRGKLAGWTGAVILFTLVIIASNKSPVADRSAVPAVRADTVCMDNSHRRMELHHEGDVSEFEETFPAGCGVLLYLPPKWGGHWHMQPVVDGTHPYAYFKRPGDHYRGPIDISSDVSVGVDIATVFYVQAAGTDMKAHFWNDVSGNTRPSDTRTDSQPNQPPPKPLIGLQVIEGDSHSCEKPDDAHYLGWHIYAAPKFLFDTHHNDFNNSDTPVNWANGFKGNVPVCYLVDDKGNIANIVLLQSVGDADLERHIKEVVQGWRYQAGMWEDEPVKTQMLREFRFH
jgi:TonB family protein